MDIEELKEIIRLLKDEGLTEITVSDGDQRVTVKRTLQMEAASRDVASSSTPAPAGVDSRPLSSSEFALTAPLVGTFYRRPSPDDDPFVEVGDVVQPGDTVCIIEAMKVMNEIKAESPGRIREVLPEEGAVVEFGQTLLILDRP